MPSNGHQRRLRRCSAETQVDLVTSRSEAGSLRWAAIGEGDKDSSECAFGNRQSRLVTQGRLTEFDFVPDADHARHAAYGRLRARLLVVPLDDSAQRDHAAIQLCGHSVWRDRDDSNAARLPLRREYPPLRTHCRAAFPAPCSRSIRTTYSRWPPPHVFHVLPLCRCLCGLRSPVGNAQCSFHWIWGRRQDYASRELCRIVCSPVRDVDADQGLRACRS